MIENIFLDKNVPILIRCCNLVITIVILLHYYCIEDKTIHIKIGDDLLSSAILYVPGAPYKNKNTNKGLKYHTIINQILFVSTFSKIKSHL